MPSFILKSPWNGLKVFTPHHLLISPIGFLTWISATQLLQMSYSPPGLPRRCNTHLSSAKITFLHRSHITFCIVSPFFCLKQGQHLTNDSCAIPYPLLLALPFLRVPRGIPVRLVIHWNHWFLWSRFLGVLKALFGSVGDRPTSKLSFNSFKVFKALKILLTYTPWVYHLQQSSSREAYTPTYCG